METPLGDRTIDVTADTTTGTRPAALTLAAATAPVLWVRATLLAQSDTPVSLTDLWGLGSDLALALLVSSVLLSLRSTHRLLAGVAGGLWGTLQYAAFEHIHELDANLQAVYGAYLLDPVFLTGSALTPSQPGLLLALIAVPAVLATLAPRSPGARVPLLLAFGGAGLLMILELLPEPAGGRGWRELHFAHQAILTLGSPAIAAAEGETLEEFRADLRGTPRFETDVVPLEPGSNVLLILLEGVTGSYVAPIAEAHGVVPQLALPRLSQLANQNLVATTFITQQRQTNRGLYALLCGDYPKLASQLAKMTEYLDGGSRRCLPAVLGDAGYHSVYLQGAPLGFMFKDAFMERIGFDAVLGDRHFQSPRIRKNWGVDDGSLFEEATTLIEDLEREPRPWFVTLLTVGTHHPFTLPPDREPRIEGPTNRLDSALRYMDESLGNFLDGLDAQGVLEHTLVIISVDESRGRRAAGGRVARLLSQSWGVLIALLPGAPALTVDEPFAQSDVALSIVDALGMEASATPFIGRSFLRAYPGPRRIFFSNTHQRRTGAVVGDDRIFLCDEAISHCEKFSAPSPGLFGDAPVPADFEPGEFEDPAAVVGRSLLGSSAGRDSLAFELARPDTVPIWGVSQQRILDGQNLYVPGHSRISVRIEVELLGDEGSAHLSHVLDDSSQQEFARPELPELHVGETLNIDYEVDTEAPIRNLKCRLKVADSRGENLILRILTARLEITPIPSLQTEEDAS
ncbi:sulfatase-like hydrolase/transferase [Myxococcota bacterium]|nr:sulfatase-like hydrolase/transferase [Myxococcota bacterium]